MHRVERKTDHSELYRGNQRAKKNLIRGVWVIAFFVLLFIGLMIWAA